jgi:hypothetical protein
MTQAPGTHRTRHLKSRQFCCELTLAQVLNYDAMATRTAAELPSWPMAEFPQVTTSLDSEVRNRQY